MCLDWCSDTGSDSGGGGGSNSGVWQFLTNSSVTSPDCSSHVTTVTPANLRFGEPSPALEQKSDTLLFSPQVSTKY